MCRCLLISPIYCSIFQHKTEKDTGDRTRHSFRSEYVGKKTFQAESSYDETDPGVYTGQKRKEETDRGNLTEYLRHIRRNTCYIFYPVSAIRESGQCENGKGNPKGKEPIETPHGQSERPGSIMEGNRKEP